MEPYLDNCFYLHTSKISTQLDSIQISEMIIIQGYSLPITTFEVMTNCDAIPGIWYELQMTWRYDPFTYQSLERK